MAAKACVILLEIRRVKLVLLNRRGYDQVGLVAACVVAVAENLPGDLVQIRCRAAQRNRLAVGHNQFGCGFGEIDGAGAIH